MAEYIRKRKAAPTWLDGCCLRSSGVQHQDVDRKSATWKMAPDRQWRTMQKPVPLTAEMGTNINTWTQLMITE